MSIEERRAYADACRLIERFGMKLVTQEMYDRIEAMDVVVDAATYIERGMRGDPTVSTTEAEWLTGRKQLRDAIAALDEVVG